MQKKKKKSKQKPTNKTKNPAWLRPKQDLMMSMISKYRFPEIANCHGLSSLSNGASKNGKEASIFPHIFFLAQYWQILALPDDFTQANLYVFVN